jgi:hypothetical protein
MVLDEITSSCVNAFRKPKLQQWVINIMLDRFCNCMPDVAQKLYVTMIGAHLIGSVPEEEIIYTVGKYVVFLYE